MYRKDLVSVIMPAYNEEKTIENIVKRVLKQSVVDRLIIVDDASRDDTAKKIKKIAEKSKKIIFFRNKKNMGKGYSVRAGLDLVSNGVVIIQDADEEYFPEDYPKLLAVLDKNTVVFGTRMKDENRGHYYLLAWFANAFLTLLFNILYNKRITDINTGYKVFNKNMLDGIELRQNRFLIEPEISIKLVKKRYKIKEVLIRYKGRTYLEGKKIKASDGIKQALYMIVEKFIDY